MSKISKLIQDKGGFGEKKERTWGFLKEQEERPQMAKPISDEVKGQKRSQRPFLSGSSRRLKKEGQGKR